MFMATSSKACWPSGEQTRLRILQLRCLLPVTLGAVFSASAKLSET